MIKVTFAQIRNLNFNPLLTRLLQSKMPYDCAEKLLNILTAVREAQGESDQIWAKLAGLFLEPIDDKDQASPLKLKDSLNEEQREQAVKKINEFILQEVKLEVAPLPVKAFKKIELTAEELMLLKGLIA